MPPPRQNQASPLGPSRPSSRPERPSASAPPVLEEQQPTPSHPTAAYQSHEEQRQYAYQYVEYVPYYPAPMTGYGDDRPFTAPPSGAAAAAPRAAATFAAPPLARTTSLRKRVRNGLRRLGRALSFGRRRKGAVVDNEAYDPAGAYYDYDQAYGYDEAELERRQRARRHRGSPRSLSRPQTAAEGAGENPPHAPVARAVFFDGIVDRHGQLASPSPALPPPAAAAAAVTPVTNPPPGPSAAARRRAKFSGDDDDLYYKTVGRDAESGVTYREARYK